MFQGNLKILSIYPSFSFYYYSSRVLYIPSLKSEKPSPDSHLDDSVVLLKERLGSAYLVTKTRLGQ